MGLLESEYMTMKDCEIFKLKKEEEEQLAAVECLKFMDFTYKDGRWFDADCESEEEEEDIFKAENDKYDKLEKEIRLEEDNKAFAKNIVQDIIDNALNKVTH